MEFRRAWNPLYEPFFRFRAVLWEIDHIISLRPLRNPQYCTYIFVTTMMEYFGRVSQNPLL